MHVTKFEREKDSFPLPFAVKLRKHIKNRRCTAVRQLGLDRVIDLTFGVGDKAHHLIFEFYASGNMILTDHEFKILDLLRVHTYETKKEKDKNKKASEKTQKKQKKKKKSRRKKRSNSSSSIQSNSTTETTTKSEENETSVSVGRVYPLALAARNVTDILSSLKASKEEEEEKEAPTSIMNLNAQRLESAVRLCLLAESNEIKTKDHMKKKIGLKWFLTSRLDCTKVFGSDLISHCIVSSKISLRATLELDEKGERIQGLELKEFETLSESLRTLPSLLVQIVRDAGSEGFILLRKKKSDEDDSAKRYEEYVVIISLLERVKKSHTLNLLTGTHHNSSHTIPIERPCVSSP